MFNYTIPLGFIDYDVEVTGYEPATGEGWHEPYYPPIVHFTVKDEEGNVLEEGDYPLGLEEELLAQIKLRNKKY